MTAGPLVSIGIPTYQRAGTLIRALDSALAQSYSPVEVLVFDNASDDGTEELCRAVSARDPRVRYVRHERNIGPTANFNALFAACRGEYVLMLADDDWLDADYVAACVTALRDEPTMALVGGLARYLRDGAYAHDEVAHDHCQADPAARVRSYLATVRDNGIFYGVVPRAVLRQASPLPNVLGNDWLHVARIAVQGRVRTLDDVHVHRALGGTSVDVGSILGTFGRADWQARIPQVVIAWELLCDIGWRHSAYARLGRRGRLALGVAGAVDSMRWRDLAWHLVTPSVAKLARRPRGRAIWAMYQRVTRALGAGRAP